MPGYVGVVRGNGPLVVSSTNARYLTDRTGIPIYMAGSHTWDNGQDQAGVTFDWTDYLDYLESWGHNFIRYWMWESVTPNGTASYYEATGPISPMPWTRPGPGSAADGGDRWDLSSYNSDYFNRVRQRCIDAGQRGIYVAVMLFNGFSVADKGGGDDPWPYHPMEDGNNINSIDGDTDNDGDGYETQDNSISAITDLQKAYIDEVLSYVDDLDNVFYEMCNEADGNEGGETWQAEILSYLQANTDKPIWYTVCSPGGHWPVIRDSGAEVVSPASAVTCDGTAVVIFDTDHEFGIGGSADWAWQRFTRGAGGTAYMDSYNNDWLDASPAGHPIQNIRDNLGYIVTLANLADIDGTVPQDGGTDPCETGFCLYGGSQYVCYQDGNGNFDLDLSGESGTFYIRKVNLADGSLDNAQSVSGGAVRAITQPSGWLSGWAAWARK